MKNSNNNHLVPISISLYLCFFVLHLISAANSSSYIPTDKIFLNCGGPSDTQDSELWFTDIGSKFLPSVDNSITSPASSHDSSVTQIPYMTARIFHSVFTYSFPVVPGRKFVRLYFYPSIYANLNPSNAVFSVSSDPYTLLSNFNVSQTTEALNSAFIVKEFSVNVQNGKLNITFKPSSNTSNAYAFVNGIEIVSMPDIYNTADGKVFIVGQSSPFYIDNSTALENIIRLNVGGNYISPSEDTGMFRSWDNDLQYIFSSATLVTRFANSNLKIKYPQSMPAYVAPTDIYATARSRETSAAVNQNYNLTWVFQIEPGFFYLVRLHFCEVEQDVTRPFQRVFEIFINNQTAEDEADVVAWTGENGIPVYKDYVVLVPQGKGQQKLWLALHPSTLKKPEYYDAILNGLEIFKVNDSNGNLARPNPIPARQELISLPFTKTSSSTNSKNKTAIIARGILGGVAAVFLLCLIVFLLSRHRRQKKDSSSSAERHGTAKTNTTGSYTSSLPSNICRKFSFWEIKAATNNFDEALLLGVGGFGKVYKGQIDGGSTTVAIKRGNPLSEQGVPEFLTEIKMLSELRHFHLVSLIGCCEEYCETILVYDYMANGTLCEHLYKTNNPPLPWKKRLEICIGAARGLHYLHTGAKRTIIHRDVKTTNILLDENWVAKVSDFGLSKAWPSTDHTHISTIVKGTLGYIDPEYYKRQQLTEKSDVYSFGVILFEVLCALPAMNATLANDQESLVNWALRCQKHGVLGQIIDPYLKGKIAPECFKKFAETAEKCVEAKGIDRPSMSYVLWSLEFALKLQEESMEDSGGAHSHVDIEETPFTGKYGEKKDSNLSLDLCSNVTGTMSIGTTMNIGGPSIGNQDSHGLTPNAVFSEILTGNDSEIVSNYHPPN